MKARYSEPALADLERILAHIKEQNPTAAQKMSAHIKKAVQRLERFPYSARATRQPDVRVLPLARYPYLVFYTVEEQAREVHILRVRHMARDPKQHPGLIGPGYCTPARVAVDGHTP